MLHKWFEGQAISRDLGKHTVVLLGLHPYICLLLTCTTASPCGHFVAQKMQYILPGFHLLGRCIEEHKNLNDTQVQLIKIDIDLQKKSKG